MKIVALSINPLFDDRVIGGSTKHLRTVVTRLAEDGHDVTVLCTGRPDTVPFNWHPRAQVLPVLHHKQPFPQPYDIPSFAMAGNIAVIAEHLADADRLYSHDGEFLFPAVAGDLPTIVSLRDNAYPETMLGSYLWAPDVLITIAEFSRDVVLAGPGRFAPGLAARTRMIHNGIDFDAFCPDGGAAAQHSAAELRALLGIETSDRTVVLHPHRPEPSKGLPQTLAVVDRLVHDHGRSDLLLLVPDWFDTDAGEETREFARGMQAEVDARGLTGHVHVHPWVPQRLMPDYYRLGDLTLALGHFMEAFGNTVYESLACGTPAIAARVSTHRTLMPDELLPKVHFGDADDTTQVAAAMLDRGRSVAPEVHEYLRRHFSLESQLDGYAEAIVTARKLPALRHEFQPLTAATPMRLAPWCYFWGDARCWHDYLAVHRHLPLLAELLDAGGGVVTLGAHPDVAGWYRDGYLVPEPGTG